MIIHLLAAPKSGCARFKSLDTVVTKLKICCSCVLEFVSDRSFVNLQLKNYTFFEFISNIQ